MSQTSFPFSVILKCKQIRRTTNILKQRNFALAQLCKTRKPNQNLRRQHTWKLHIRLATQEIHQKSARKSSVSGLFRSAVISYSDVIKKTRIQSLRDKETVKVPRMARRGFIIDRAGANIPFSYLLFGKFDRISPVYVRTGRVCVL